MYTSEMTFLAFHPWIFPTILSNSMYSCPYKRYSTLVGKGIKTLFWQNSIHSLKYLRRLRHRIAQIKKVENQSLGQRLILFVYVRISWMEASSYLPLLLWDGRRVLSLRRADLRHEVRELDLRRIPGTVFSLKELRFFFCHNLWFSINPNIFLTQGCRP